MNLPRIIKIFPFTPDQDHMPELAMNKGVCKAPMKKHVQL